MRRALILPALVLLLLPAGAWAQQPATAPAERPAQETPRENRPDWPQGLESWDSEEREPENPDPNEAERRGLTSPAVKDSLMPNPTPQGNRPPEPAVTEEFAAGTTLYGALFDVRRAPPTLDGARRTPRPNPLGSEPELEMRPDPRGNPDSLFPQNYVE